MLASLSLSLSLSPEKCRGEELRLLLVESEGSVEMLGVEVAALQDKVVSLEEECQDRCRMANEWYEALKVSYNIFSTLPPPLLVYFGFLYM